MCPLLGLREASRGLPRPFTPKERKSSRSKSLSPDWYQMVREWEDEEEKSSVKPERLTTTYKDTTFCTLSTYSGRWSNLGMAHWGRYGFPWGCEYEGSFEDGMFHGEGVLTYPMGQKLEGLWVKGKMVEYKFSNVDGLEYSDNWDYCRMPDRRFTSSIREGLQPAGREFMTDQQPEREVEPGMYDTGDGFYDPVTRSVYSTRENDEDVFVERADVIAETPEEDPWINSINMVSEDRHEWIISHCRRGWDEPSGYRPEFYQDWTSGKQSELDELDKKYLPQDLSNDSSADDADMRLFANLSLFSEEKKSAEYAGTGRKLKPSTSKTDVD